LHKLRRTNVIELEVNPWAKVANKNKQQTLMYKTAVYTLVITASLHIKNSKYQKGVIAQQL